MVVKRSVSLKEQAYHAIRDCIVSNKMQRGQIYSEQWFADSFQISRTPVREALLQFRSEGLIDVLPNRGVILRNPTRQDARSIFEMRGAIEGFCAAYLARRCREPEGRASLERIKASLERCRLAFSQGDEMLIHEETIRFSGNPMFREQFDRMRTKIDIFWWNVINAENRRESVYREHKAIFDSMAAGDEARTYDASIRHSMATLQLLYEQFPFADDPEIGAQ